MMEQKNIESWATVLHEARTAGKPIPQISPRIVGFTRADAYAVQERQTQLRQIAGERQIGWKMGLTSEAKRKQMNLDAPLYGVLTDVMQILAEGTFFLEGSIHPKIEPEIAFLIKKDLHGAVTRSQVLEATAGVCAALEILDSRYEQFKYFSMEDVISDNSSSSHFILGAWRDDFHSLSLENLKMTMQVNGRIAQEGNTRDISNDPVISVIQLCDLLAQRNQFLRAGSLVLAGAATAAVELKPDMRVSLEVEGLTSFAVNIKAANTAVSLKAANTAVSLKAANTAVSLKAANIAVSLKKEKK